MKMLRLITAALAAVVVSAPALAAGDYRKPEHHHWHFAGPFGTYDKQQLQRGYQVYEQVCSSCHGMELLSFRNLGEPGGPFRSMPTGEMDSHGHPEMIEYTDPNANPYVRAIAAQYIMIGDQLDPPEYDEFGDPVERPGEPKDQFPSPYANDNQARSVNNNALPPDLSVIVHARHYGVDYIRSLLLGYGEDVPYDVEVGDGQYYNPYFPGGVLSMAPPLVEGAVTYMDGTPETIEQYAEDVTAFLAWAADPHMVARKQMGFAVIAYLFLFSILMWFVYRQVWAKVEH